jgi:hypothetical protein
MFDSERIIETFSSDAIFIPVFSRLAGKSEGAPALSSPSFGKAGRVG